ncbi:MAG: AAA family ATPase, partial [Mycobacteriales bacterium]
ALAGTGGDEKLFTANPALLRLFRVARTRDFATPEYVDLFRQAVEHQGAIARDDTAADAGDMLARNPGVRNLRNGRLVDYLATLAVAEARKRTGKDRGFVVRPEDLPATVLPGATGVGGSSAVIPADPQTELAGLIGLAGLKREVELLVAEAKAEKLRREAGLPVSGPARHMVFLGNPGTAKTTVARLLAAIYRQLGLLSSGHLVEVSRADLIAEYIGQTAPKVVATVERALGGVLFVDEAYALAQSDSSRDFGHEAIATLLKLMEDHRDDLVVIAAGYEREMKGFLAANSGLASRFPRQLHFPDYSDEELVEIFAKMATDAGFTLAGGVTDRVRALVAGVGRDNRFGNGRLVRNLLERAVALQARRITSGETTPDQLAQIRPEDLPDDLDAADRTADTGTGMYL